MLNSYGSSIASSFPAAFCLSSSIQQCQLCGIKNGTKINSNNLNQTKIKYELIVKIEKCLHCDLNICDQCLNKTSQINSFKKKGNNDKNDDIEDDDEIIIHDYDKPIDFKPNIYEQHYDVLRKEFKKNYKYIKSTSEKANKLSSILKNDEISLNEMSLIKQQVNKKAEDLIKQIENERNDLNEKIDNIMSEYEEDYNQKKNIFQTSFQVKDELKKIIKKYKDAKAVNSSLTLKELLDLHEKSKVLFDYVEDGEVLANMVKDEKEEKTKFSFEEKPVYRSLIGEIISSRPTLQKVDPLEYEEKSKKEIASKKIQSKSNLNKRQENLDMTRSVSLNDLIAAANELIIKEKTINKKGILKKDQKKKEIQPPAPPSSAAAASSITESSGPIYSKNLNIKLSNEIKESIDAYQRKLTPNERLDIDIEPSFIRVSNNKLLVASSDGKIRIYDLSTNKIEKDEIQNVLISSICMPFNKQNDILFAITIGEVEPENDEFSLSNSVIIVTKKELKVLKKDSSLTSNDDYNFNNPCGILFDKFNNLYICDSGYNRVKILDQNYMLTETIETAANLNDHLNTPNSLCICHEKSLLFICDSGNHRIIAYDILNSGKKFSFKNVYGYGYGEETGKMRFPLDCSVDKLGFLLIRDLLNSRIQIFGPNTMIIHKIDFNETIFSITSGDSGEIYVGKTSDTKQEESVNQRNYFIDIY